MSGFLNGQNDVTSSLAICNNAVWALGEIFASLTIDPSSNQEILK